MAIYCRVSADDQSCERQERDLRAFAKRAGHKIVAVFKETATGANNARPKRGLSVPMPFFSPAPACCSPAAHEQDEQKDDDDADQDAPTLSVKQVVCDHNDVRQRRGVPCGAQ